MYDSFNFPYLINKNLVVFPVNYKYTTFYQSPETNVLFILIKRQYGNFYLTFMNSKNTSKGPIGDVIKKMLTDAVQ